MKKIVTGLVIVAVILLAAPWGIGRIAEARVDQQIDQFVEQVPFLGVVERKYARGWFRSTSEVTFEVLGPWARVAGDGTNSPRFTVHNDILHGPILGLAGIGIARVDSRVLFGAELRHKLLATIGTDEPLRVSTRIGFFGSRKTTFSSDKRTVKLDDGTEVSWDDLDLSMTYTSDFDSIDYVGDWPRFEVNNFKTRDHVLVEKLILDGTSERLGGDLYDTDVDMRIGSVKITDAAGKTGEIDDARYEVGTSLDGDFVSYSVRLGSGALKGDEFRMLGADIKEMHYDFTARRLHEKTMERLATAVKQSYSIVPQPGVSDEIAKFGPIKAQALALFAYDPELVLDRVGLATEDGDAYIKGVLKFVGVTEKDLSVGGLGLFGKLEANLDFSAPQKLMDKADGGANWVNSMVDQGFLERKGDKVVSHIEFRNGQLKINGKAQGIPGLGGPPATAPSGAPESPPPQ
jgi:uncharacterized protein YdgA (DUF945 family)